MLTIGEYLNAVRHMHGLTIAEMARALRVAPSAVRRWKKGRLIPGWGRIRAMATLWGGDPYVLMLAALLQRFARTTGMSFEEAERLARQGRRPAARPARRGRRPRDRRQLSLPIGR